MRRVYLELFNKDSKVIAYGANARESVTPELLDRWNLGAREYFLIVGRLVPDNNADLIIDGFLKSNSQRKLVVVGDAPFADEWATRLKNIRDPRLLFTGYVTDPNELATLYSHCYAYFHGHEFGGTNPAMLKALGYGCAILALDTPFNQEMLQNGKHGWYFGKNVDAVKEIVEKSGGEPEKMEEFRGTARSGLIQRYNWDHVTEQYLEVFKNLAKK